MLGDDVMDRKREAREAGFVEDKELYFWRVRLKETAEHPAKKHIGCEKPEMGTGNWPANREWQSRTLAQDPILSCHRDQAIPIFSFLFFFFIFSPPPPPWEPLMEKRFKREKTRNSAEPGSEDWRKVIECGEHLQARLYQAVKRVQLAGGYGRRGKGRGSRSSPFILETGNEMEERYYILSMDRYSPCIWSKSRQTCMGSIYINFMYMHT